MTPSRSSDEVAAERSLERAAVFAALRRKGAPIVNANGSLDFPCPICGQDTAHVPPEGVSTRVDCSHCKATERLILAALQDHDAAKLRLHDTFAFVTTDPPPLDWLVDGVFCRGKLTLFGGREKRGKSLIQLVLAVRMASGGGTLAGISVMPGRVLLIDAENGKSELHRRIRATSLAAEHVDQLRIAEARGFDLRDDLGEVADLADRHQVDLVLLDSFRSLWRGDERDEGQVAEALDPLRELAHDRKLAISLTHHLPKHGDQEYRGSTAIGACVDWCVVLDREREDTDKGRRRLTNPLARIAPERPDRWLRIASEGDDGPVRLDEAEPFIREHDAPVRSEMEEKIAQHIEGVWGEALVKGDHTPTPPTWSTADLARAVRRDPKDWTVRQAVSRLAERGVIHRNGDAGRWHRSQTLLDNTDGRDAAREDEDA